MASLSDLRAHARDLPNAHGTYTFHGHGGVPLYIGKSIHIRTRVLDHLRSASDARLNSSTLSFSFIRTAGDIGAQLLEAQQVKHHQPLFNHRLRRNRKLCTLTFEDGELTIANVHEAGHAPSYGLFASRHAAIEGLRAIADDHLLCYSRLGIEKLQTGRSCFRHSIRRCLGVCCGKEADDAHRHRLLSALVERHVQAWPYPGAIGIIERSSDLEQIHVVRNWSYLGSASDKAAAKKLTKPAPGFDRDGYKILVKPLLSKTVELIELP
jgi:excinuclease Cho